MLPAGEIKILIVDDHELIRHGIMRAFEGEDDIHIIADVESSSLALETIKVTPPDIVLMDIQLGGGEDGIAVAEQIKNGYPDVKVVLISMYDDEIYIERAIAAGVDGYVLKDIHRDTLLKAVRVVAKGDTFMDSRITRQLMRQYTSLKRSKQVEPLTQAAPAKTLSPREADVVVQLAHGLSNKEIADKLSISEQTVKTHVYNVFRKLEVGNRIELTLYAVRMGLVETSVST